MIDLRFTNPIPVPLLLLGALLLITRMGHVLSVPDASWAVFMLGGYYLRGAYLRGVYAFTLLLCVALFADIFAVSVASVDASCITWGYTALIPTYAALWYGGCLLPRRLNRTVSCCARCVVLPVMTVSIAFAISNLGFYWGSMADTGLSPGAFVVAVARYYPLYAITTLSYVASIMTIVTMGTYVLRAYIRPNAHLMAERTL